MDFAVLKIQRYVKRWLKNRANHLFNQAKEFFKQRHYMTAWPLLNRAILLGHLRAHAYMAWYLLQTGSDTLPQSHPRYQQAIALLEVGASKGCDDCQGVLAYCHIFGKGMKGCKMDFDLAWVLATKSNANKSVFGTFALACLIKDGLPEKGISVAQGAERSVELFWQAVHEEFYDAYKPLIMAHESGVGVYRNYVTARTLLDYLVDKGDGWAYKRLAQYYKEGLGVEIDLVKSEELDFKAFRVGY
jgi:TPR repeat protein